MTKGQVLLSAIVLVLITALIVLASTGAFTPEVAEAAPAEELTASEKVTEPVATEAAPAVTQAVGEEVVEPAVEEEAVPVVLIDNCGNEVAIGENQFSITDKIAPEAKPWEWVWRSEQSFVTDHNQWPSECWATLAQRPDTWMIIDANVSGTADGYAEHAVTIYYLPDGVPQRDVFIKYGQYHVLRGDTPVEDVIALSRAIASHTGSSNRSTINFVIAEQK